jgi:hypothetical protein
MADQEQPSPEPWANSEAKKMLIVMINDGTITEDSNVEEVYNSQQEFQKYNIRNFRTNIRNLIAAIRRREECARFDTAALETFRELHPRPPVTHGDYPFWDTSEASRFLTFDIDNGRHLQMTPKQLRNTRQEYQAFPLNIFRKHLHQERQRRIKKSYWLYKKQKEENQKQNKNKKR